MPSAMGSLQPEHHISNSYNAVTLTRFCGVNRTNIGPTYKYTAKILATTYVDVHTIRKIFRTTIWLLTHTHTENSY